MGRQNVAAIRSIGMRDTQHLATVLFDPPERPSNFWSTRIRLRPIGRCCHALDPSKTYVALGKPD